jgi:hypothetical protein
MEASLERAEGSLHVADVVMGEMHGFNSELASGGGITLVVGSGAVAASKKV